MPMLRDVQELEEMLIVSELRRVYELEASQVLQAQEGQVRAGVKQLVPLPNTVKESVATMEASEAGGERTSMQVLTNLGVEFHADCCHAGASCQTGG